MTKQKISIVKTISVFVLFTAYFYLLLFTLFPFLKSNFSLNPALYWFITGYFIFVPLFVCAILMVKIEGNKGIKQIAAGLNIKPFSKKEWLYSIGGLLLVFFFTGVIFGISILLTKYLGIRKISTTPWFMEMHPFKGSEKLLLLIWLPMFFFNIVGEELLWRGYIQTRLEGPYSWLLCSLLWLLFHLPFGFDLMIILTPIMLIVPYVYSKTQNSLTGVFIHGLYNGPIFVIIALGIM